MPALHMHSLFLAYKLMYNSACLENCLFMAGEETMQIHLALVTSIQD